MNPWTSFVAWFRKQGGVWHGVAAIYLTLIGLYAEVPSFAALVDSIYAKIPATGHQIILAVLGILAFYTRTAKEQ